METDIYQTRVAAVSYDRLPGRSPRRAACATVNLSNGRILHQERYDIVSATVGSLQQDNFIKIAE
jgi:hypothetical protein